MEHNHTSKENETIVSNRNSNLSSNKNKDMAQVSEQKIESRQGQQSSKSRVEGVQNAITNRINTSNTIRTASQSSNTEEPDQPPSSSFHRPSGLFKTIVAPIIKQNDTVQANEYLLRMKILELNQSVPLFPPNKPPTPGLKNTFNILSKAAVHENPELAKPKESDKRRKSHTVSVANRLKHGPNIDIQNEQQQPQQEKETESIIKAEIEEIESVTASAPSKTAVPKPTVVARHSGTYTDIDFISATRSKRRASRRNDDLIIALDYEDENVIENARISPNQTEHNLPPSKSTRTPERNKRDHYESPKRQKLADGSPASTKFIIDPDFDIPSDIIPKYPPSPDQDEVNRSMSELISHLRASKIDSNQSSPQKPENLSNTIPTDLLNLPENPNATFPETEIPREAGRYDDDDDDAGGDFGIFGNAGGYDSNDEESDNDSIIVTEARKLPQPPESYADFSTDPADDVTQDVDFILDDQGYVIPRPTEEESQRSIKEELLSEQGSDDDNKESEDDENEQSQENIEQSYESSNIAITSFDQSHGTNEGEYQENNHEGDEGDEEESIQGDYDNNDMGYDSDNNNAHEEDLQLDSENEIGDEQEHTNEPRLSLYEPGGIDRNNFRTFSHMYFKSLIRDMISGFVGKNERRLITAEALSSLGRFTELFVSELSQSVLLQNSAANYSDDDSEDEDSDEERSRRKPKKADNNFRVKGILSVMNNQHVFLKREIMIFRAQIYEKIRKVHQEQMALETEQRRKNQITRKEAAFNRDIRNYELRFIEEELNTMEENCLIDPDDYDDDDDPTDIIFGKRYSQGTEFDKIVDEIRAKPPSLRKFLDVNKVILEADNLATESLAGELPINPAILEKIQGIVAEVR